jgi:PTS system mannose-specific IIC component
VTTLPLWSLLLLVLWGVIAGLDLVSVPQGLLSRPLVAATVAGLIAGNVSGGLMAGVVLELYALDVLPIGASRYPDYSVASVAGGLAGALAPAPLAAALAGLVGLPMAALGGWTLLRLRRRNAVSVQRRLARVAAGEQLAIWQLQRNGFLRDAVRSLALAAIGVVAALLVARVHWSAVRHASLLSWASLAGGLAAALGGAVRSAGHGARRRWLACGLATGLAVVLLQ